MRNEKRTYMVVEPVELFITSNMRASPEALNHAMGSPIAYNFSDYKMT